MREIVVKMDKITKQFGKLVANKETNLEIEKGEIHALLGENGAGKSTLMNILAGVYKQTSGDIYIDGNRVSLSSPNDALKHGIGMIYQHFKLVENMTALDNIIGGMKKGLFVSYAQRKAEVSQLCEETGLHIEIDKRVAEMSISEKQTLEIIKALYRGAKILILDEPTAVLTPQETKKLFEVIKKMKKQGHSIIIITHKLNEIMENTDRVTVLRAGENITTVVTSESSPTELTNLMVGSSTHFEIKREPCLSAEIGIEVAHLTYQNEDQVKLVDEISFEVYKGEVLGVAGVAGSGQKQLCEVLAGILPASKGDIIYQGKSVIQPHNHLLNRQQLRVGFVPENRLSMGLVGSMNMVDNLLLRMQDHQKGIFIKEKAAKEMCERLIQQLEIKTMGTQYPVKMMSGGNIQKVLLGREMQREVDFFMVSYPVRGLDTAATHAVYEMLNQIKAEGIPILFVGEDLDHLLAFSDRIMVMCQGKSMGIVESSQTTKEALGEMMAGKQLETRESVYQRRIRLENQIATGKIGEQEEASYHVG